MNKTLSADIGIILRCDDYLKEMNFEKVDIVTDYGTCNRIYIGNIGNKKVAFLYGRFDGIRTPSWEINFKQNQMALTKLGVNHIIGTFVTGSIAEEHKAGDIFIPQNYVGFGSIHENLIVNQPFKNIDMFDPFCCNLRDKLKRAAEHISIPYKEGIYLSFNGFPRIETSAELKVYEKLGFDIVGQTLDSEASLARQMKTHYAAICVTIDDIEIRKNFLTDPIASRQLSRKYIRDGRAQMLKIILEMISNMDDDNMNCSCSYSFENETDYFNTNPDFD